MNAIDADETPSDGAGDLVGALDLGGASTQVATALRQRVPPQLNKKHFSVATYLGYGVERFHERYIKTVDRDPCAQPADFDGCRSAIASALGIMDCRSQHKQPCALPFDSGEDEAPPEPIKPAPNARFVATSLYFYAWRTLHQALPLLVELGGEEYDTAYAKKAHLGLDGMWPAPSVEKAKDAAEAYCSASPALLSKAASEEIAWDAFHGDSARRHRDFPRRCFEAAYVDVLLRDVVGVDPGGRALLVAIMLRGVELDWTLGAVLDADAHALRRPRHIPHASGVDGTVPVTKKHGGWRFFLLGFCGIALLLVLVSRGGNDQRRSSKLAKASPRTGGHLEFPSNGWRRAAPASCRARATSTRGGGLPTALSLARYSRSRPPSTRRAPSRRRALAACGASTRARRSGRPCPSRRRRRRFRRARAAARPGTARSPAAGHLRRSVRRPSRPRPPPCARRANRLCVAAVVVKTGSVVSARSAACTQSSRSTMVSRAKLLVVCSLRKPRLSDHSTMQGSITTSEC